MNYLASPPLVVAYAIAGTMDIDLVNDPLGAGQRRRGGLPARHLAVGAGGRRRRSRRPCSPTCSARATARSSTATSAGTGSTCPTGDRFAWDDGLDLRAPAAVLRGHAAPSRRRVERHRGRARAWPSSATGSRPTTSRRRARSRRTVPPARYLKEHGVDEARLQLLRLAPRQPRGDDARHVRQHPPAQPARARHRGRRDAPPAGRRGDVDLRRGDGVRRARARRSSSSAARSTARARRATGRRRARTCSASAP